MFFPPPRTGREPASTGFARQRWAGFARRWPWRFAAVFACAAFALSSLLPVWTAWYFSAWECNGELASFWTMLASIPRAAEHVRARELAIDFYGPELVKLGLLLVIGLGIGRWLAHRARAEAEPAAAPDPAT